MTGCGAEVRVKNGLKLISSYKWLGDEVRRKLEMEKKIATNCGGYENTRYDTRCYFNVRWKAEMSQHNLPHNTEK